LLLRAPGYHPTAAPLSPREALSSAWRETLHLLFRPFNGRRWLRLSVMCLFLGGGTSTAAFQWGFSVLPVEVHPSQILLRVRPILAAHFSLIVLAGVLSVGLVVVLLYARCVLRFMLVDAILGPGAHLRAAWKKLERPGRSYFFWLAGVLGTLIVVILGLAVVLVPYLRAAREAGDPSWLASLLLVSVLAAIIVVGLLVAVVITLTDDLVVPIVYAKRTSLPAAWREVWSIGSRDPGTLFFYIVLRFAMSMFIGVAVLAFLFPVLMGLSSGPIVAAALVVFALRLVGLAWTWNLLTIILGGLALLLLTLALFALLSVAGMPGQVYLQNLGVRFIGSRVPALEAFARPSRSVPRW